MYVYVYIFIFYATDNKKRDNAEKRLLVNCSLMLRELGYNFFHCFKYLYNRVLHTADLRIAVPPDVKSLEKMIENVNESEDSISIGSFK